MIYSRVFYSGREVVKCKMLKEVEKVVLFPQAIFFLAIEILSKFACGTYIFSLCEHNFIVQFHLLLIAE